MSRVLALSTPVDFVYTLASEGQLFCPPFLSTAGGGGGGRRPEEDIRSGRVTHPLGFHKSDFCSKNILILIDKIPFLCYKYSCSFQKEQSMFNQSSRPFTDIDRFPQELSQDQIDLLTSLYQPILKSLMDDIRNRYQRKYGNNNFRCLLNTFLKRQTDDEILKNWIYIEGYHIVFRNPLIYKGSELEISLKWNFKLQKGLLKITHINFGAEIRDTSELYTCLLDYLSRCKDEEYWVYDLSKESFEDCPLVTDRFYINE